MEEEDNNEEENFKDIEESNGNEEEEKMSHWTKKIPIEERLRVSKLPYYVSKKLKEILDGLKWAIHFKKQSAVIIVDGRSGMGKTTLSFQCAKYMNENFSLDNVYFTPEAFLEGLSKAQKGEVLIFDEAMLLSSRAALSAINKMVVIAMSMIRSKNLLIIFNVNSIFDLDKNLALSRADLLLHCYGESLTDKGKYLAFFKGGDGRDRIKELYLNGKKYYSYATPKSNFFTNFSAHFVLDEAEYEAKKQVGVNNFLKSGKLDKVSKDRLARDRAIIELYLKLSKTQEEIAEIIGISSKAVYEVLKKYKEEVEKNGETISFAKRPKPRRIFIDN